MPFAALAPLSAPPRLRKAAPCRAPQRARMPVTRSARRVSASAAVSSPAQAASAPLSSRRVALELANESTKFVVSFTAFCVLLYYRNAAASVALFGSILASLAGKLLKRLLAHARPDGARKADPGMPSSHAVSLGYLASYAAACCSGLPERAALQLAGLLLTALRVVLGFHTVPQVVVGYALGGSSALVLHALAESVLLPALDTYPALLLSLYWATAASVLAFALVSSKSWVADARALVAAAGARRE